MKPKPRPPTRVLLVEDHALMRQALREMLAAEGGLEIVGEAEDAAAALQLVADTAPELAILDISLKGPMNGLELTTRLKFSHPGLKVLVVSLYAADEWAERAREAGADGYVCKADAPALLPKALAALRRGRPYGFQPFPHAPPRETSARPPQAQSPLPRHPTRRGARGDARATRGGATAARAPLPRGQRPGPGGR